MAAWKIGPTFVGELQAASVSLDGYSWDIMTGTFVFPDDAAPELVAAVNAVYAAHDPMLQTEPPTPWPPGALPVILSSQVPPPPPSTRWQVDRQLVIERLEATHRFAAFANVLEQANALTYALWQARYRVWNDDPLVIGLLQDAGADPAIILARP